MGGSCRMLIYCTAYQLVCVKFKVDKEAKKFPMNLEKFPLCKYRTTNRERCVV